MKKKFIAWLLATIMILAVFTTAIIPSSAAGPCKTQLTIYAPVNVYSLQAFDISGKLIASPAGAGVQGMPVSVYCSVNGRTWNILGTSITDSGGYYKVSTIEKTAGKYMYRASFSGGKVYMPATSAKATVMVDQKKATTLTINAPASVYTDEMWKVRAYLKDAAGIPLEGQEVEFKIEGPGLSGTSTLIQTEADGLACKSYIGLAAGQYTIQVTFYGTNEYAPAAGTPFTVEVKEKTLTATTLSLDQPTGALSGEPITFTGKLTASDGSVMYGKDVHIQVYNPDTRQWDTLATAATDGIGAFTTSGVISDVGNYQIWAVYDGGNEYSGDTSDPYNVEVRFNPKTGLTLAFQPSNVYATETVKVSGKLTDSNGAGLPGMTIKFQKLQGDTWVEYPMFTYTDESGAYDWKQGTWLGAGTYIMRAFFEGDDRYAGTTSSEATYIVELMPTKLDLAVSPNPATSGEPITFSGKITDANNIGLPGVTITLQFTEEQYGSVFTETTQTDASGDYKYSTPIGARTNFKVKAIFVSTDLYASSMSEEVAFVVNPEKLATPTLVSPADGAVFDHYPRTTTITWDPVPYADSYYVEVQAYSNNIWFTCRSYTVTETSYTFDFVGMQPGRWSVTALDSTGIYASSDPSEWRGFEYTI